MKKAAFVASILTAIGSGGLGHLYYMRLEDEVSGGPRIPVLVAATDIPVGAAVTESSLVVREVPQAYVEERQVRASDVKKVLGAHVAGGLKTNEALLWTDLSKFNEHARVLSRLIENGMRAVAVDGRTADFDGLLRPGDRVDVLFTSGDSSGAAGTTVTLVQNLLVLSVGGNIERGEQDGKGQKTQIRGSAVSLSATVEQAQLLTLSAQHGRLSLTLRNPDDIQVIQGIPGTSANDLLREPAQVAARLDVATQRERLDHVR